MDIQNKSGEKTWREIQYSTISQEGVLASYDIYHEQIGTEAPTISNAVQTLQVYTAKQIQDMLEAHGFQVLHQYDVDGSNFNELKSERILTVAKKS